MNENEAILAATQPQNIISAQDCNEILSYLGEHINSLVADEWEKRLVASQTKVKLLSDKTKTNALTKAEFEISEDYKTWQEAVNLLRKYRAYRSDLRDRFLVLSNLKRY